MHPTPTALVRLLALMTLALGTPTSTPAQATQELPPLDHAVKSAIVDSLSRALVEVYVFPEVAAEMESRLREQLAAGAYAHEEEHAAFARALTRDLQEVSQDLHLRVFPIDPATIRGSGNGGPSPEERRRRWEEAQRRENFGFRAVERMEGNVGYLRLDGFVPTEIAGETAVAAMQFLANCDALIIDLRANGGGSPSMIQLLTTYLLDESTHLNSFYLRREDRTDQFWTAPWVPGRRLTDVPVYVLTSGRTFSAAEEFSYNLRNLERATLVGETTGGGAHPVSGVEWPELGVGMSLPFGRAVNPVSGTNWEGTGVQPHLDVPASEALLVAHREALQTLAALAEEADRAPYEWALQGLRARLDEQEVDEARLRDYAGDYGDRHVRWQDGSLLYHRGEGAPMRMIPMTDTLFRFDEVDYFRLEVMLDERGQATKLIGHYEDGRQDESPRD